MDVVPYFSIILPTYNRAKYISTAIQSVLDQSFENFELIVVDDGSVDDTKKVVTSFSEYRVKYFCKANEERNIARNFGITKAKGKYIGFLDSDDYYAKDHLSKAFEIIVNNQDYGWYYFGDLQNFAFFKRENDVRQELIKKNFFSINGVVIRSDILKQINFISSKNAIVSEDHHLWLRLAARYPMFIHPQQTTFFNEHPERSLNNIDLNQLVIGNSEIISDLKSDTMFMNYYGRSAFYYFAFKYTFVALVANEYEQYSIARTMLLKAIMEDIRIITSKRFLASVRNLARGMFWGKASR